MNHRVLFLFTFFGVLRDLCTIHLVCVFFWCFCCYRCHEQMKKWDGKRFVFPHEKHAKIWFECVSCSSLVSTPFKLSRYWGLCLRECKCLWVCVCPFSFSTNHVSSALQCCTTGFSCFVSVSMDEKLCSRQLRTLYS